MDMNQRLNLSKSNPRKPKLSPRSTIRLFSSLTSTCRAAKFALSTPRCNPDSDITLARVSVGYQALGGSGLPRR